MSSTPSKVLVLGGTAEATTLARELGARGHDTVLSLKGLTEIGGKHPVRVRVGGFGGVDGLAHELRTAGYHLLIDASHPFSAGLANNAAAAATRVGVPRLRILRPAWQPERGDRWHEVATLPEAANAVTRIGARRVFLSVGRVGATAFTGLGDVEVVLRMISAVARPPLAGATVIVDRGPFAVDAEVRLLREHRIDLLITRNSGGLATAAKLVAARRLDLPVVMVQRPAQPPGDRVENVDEALAWAEDHSG